MDSQIKKKIIIMSTKLGNQNSESRSSKTSNENKGNKNFDNLSSALKQNIKRRKAAKKHKQQDS